MTLKTLKPLMTLMTLKFGFPLGLHYLYDYVV